MAILELFVYEDCVIRRVSVILVEPPPYGMRLDLFNLLSVATAFDEQESVRC